MVIAMLPSPGATLSIPLGMTVFFAATSAFFIFQIGDSTSLADVLLARRLATVFMVLAFVAAVAAGFAWGR